MAEQQTEPTKEIERYEKRNFRYVGEDVTFEFDVDVSTPDSALAEIADFIQLMARATADLRELQKTFASKIEKPQVPEQDAGGGSNAGKTEVKK